MHHFLAHMLPKQTATKMLDHVQTSEPSETRTSERKAAEKASTTPEPMEEDTEQDSSKADAQKAKELGNAAYKARKFEEAIKHYDAAIQLDNSDISFLTNRCADEAAMCAVSYLNPKESQSLPCISSISQ